MNNILITGNRGFIGSYIQKRLEPHYNIFGINREDGIDITHLGSLEGLGDDIEIDSIIHTAAVVSNEYEVCFQANVIGALNMCRYAKEHDIKQFVLLSTIFALEEEENSYFNNYGKTKKMAEEAAAAFCQEHGITLTILRLAQVYDDKGIAKKGQPMLYYFVDTIKNKGEIMIFGKQNPLRNFIHIDYLCEVILEVVSEKKSGTWNVVENKNHTVTEIAYMLFALLDKKPQIAFAEDRADIPSVYIPKERRYVSTNITSIPLIEGLKRIITYES